jgi:hypothetical protein
MPQPAVSPICPSAQPNTVIHEPIPGSIFKLWIFDLQDEGTHARSHTPASMVVEWGAASRLVVNDLGRGLRNIQEQPHRQRFGATGQSEPTDNSECVIGIVPVRRMRLLADRDHVLDGGHPEANRTADI